MSAPAPSSSSPPPQVNAAALPTLTAFLRGDRILNGSPEPSLDTIRAAADIHYDELSQLMRMDSNRFWKADLVAYAWPLHQFVDNYLQLKRRHFDKDDAKHRGDVYGVGAQNDILHNQIFNFLHRLSCADSENHAVLLKERKWLDLPKLLDISVIFVDNHLKRKKTELVRNAIRLQLDVLDDIYIVASYFLKVVNSFCCQFTERLKEFRTQNFRHAIANQLPSEFLELEYVINDAVETMNSFINTYLPAAVFLACPPGSSDEEHLINLLARMHHTLTHPSMMHMHWRYPLCENIVNLGHNLLRFSYLTYDTFRETFDPQQVERRFPAFANGDIPSFSHNLGRRPDRLSRERKLRDKGLIKFENDKHDYLGRIFRRRR